MKFYMLANDASTTHCQKLDIPKRHQHPTFSTFAHLELASSLAAIGAQSDLPSADEAECENHPNDQLEECGVRNLAQHLLHLRNLVPKEVQGMEH
jgi:hypothetical protein